MSQVHVSFLGKSRGHHANMQTIYFSSSEAMPSIGFPLRERGCKLYLNKIVMTKIGEREIEIQMMKVRKFILTKQQTLGMVEGDKTMKDKEGIGEEDGKEDEERRKRSRRKDN